MSTEITKVENTNLANFGGRDPIKEMAIRLQTMLPGGAKLQLTEAMAVAQLAFAHDLDPFNGEVWGIGTGQSWKGIMVGIKGLRKAAKREANAENSLYWFDAPKLVDAKKYGNEKPGAIAYEMILRDSASTQAWSKAVHELTSAGIPYKEAVEMLGGKPPFTVGIGMADPGEPSKMGLHARAKKRGEAEALKIRYSLEFKGATVTVEDAPIAGEVEDMPTQDAQTFDYNQENEEQRAETEKVPAGNVIDELFPQDVPSETKTRTDSADARKECEKAHKELWARCQDAKLLSVANIEAWKFRFGDTAEQIDAKCKLMHAALGDK